MCVCVRSIIHLQQAVINLLFKVRVFTALSLLSPVREVCRTNGANKIAPTSAYQRLVKELMGSESVMCYLCTIL